MQFQSQHGLTLRGIRRDAIIRKQSTGETERERKGGDREIVKLCVQKQRYKQEMLER